MAGLTEEDMKAVFTALRDHIKCGNLAITGCKRFGKLEDFFISPNQWEATRDAFFKKNKRPQNPNDVPLYFENRLNNAFEYFLQREKNNMFAKVGKEGWELSKLSLIHISEPTRLRR